MENLDIYFYENCGVKGLIEQKIEEFDEEFIGNKMDDLLGAYGTPKNIRLFISQALLQCREETLREVENGMFDLLENHHCENNDGSSVCSCYKEALSSIQLLLDNKEKKWKNAIAKK